MPVTPALVRWRLVRGNAHAYVPWRIASDFRTSFVPSAPPHVHFGDIYAPRTRQNKPNKPGLYRIWLARRFDTRPFPDGDDPAGRRGRRHSREGVPRPPRAELRQSGPAA